MVCFVHMLNLSPLTMLCQNLLPTVSRRKKAFQLRSGPTLSHSPNHKVNRRIQRSWKRTPRQIRATRLLRHLPPPPCLNRLHIPARSLPTRFLSPSLFLPIRLLSPISPPFTFLSVPLHLSALPLHQLVVGPSVPPCWSLSSKLMAQTTSRPKKATRHTFCAL
jgi:hypothetical protein